MVTPSRNLLSSALTLAALADRTGSAPRVREETLTLGLPRFRRCS